ncbi:MAG: SusD/RagB family nutrient-binding outer membrane lipoprotein [Flavisolibacter sp.]
MKKHSYKLVYFLLLLSAFSCKKKIEDYSRNTNQPESVPPSLLLRGILNDMVVLPFNQVERQNQFTASNYTYYDNNQYWTGSAKLNYGTLNNVVSMEKEARKAAGSDNNPYHALGQFFKAYFFVEMTLKVGDLPMTEALQGLTQPSPKYDTQKQIFVQSLKWLDSANSSLSSFIQNGFLEFSGDFYYKERLNSPLSARDALIEWQKVVNTFKLRVLIQLSKKVSDPDLKVTQLFSDVIGNPSKYPLMTSMDDNLQYVYNDKFNYYPNSNQNFGNDAVRYNLAATYLNTLASLNDLRALKVAEPARGLGFADTSYSSFVGGPSGEDLSSMAAKVQAGKYSLINRKRYYEGLTGEPTFIIGYPEMCFNIAEAINRGWVTGDAASWYKTGILAMFSFFGIVDGSNVVTFQKAGGLLGEDISYTVNFNFANYFNQPSVTYAGNNPTGLNQILIQKYLSFARNSGYQAYYQWRRTGVPVFSTGPGNGNGGRIPKRYQYPVAERSTNAINYSEAVQRQFAGQDDIFATLWIDM